MPKTPTQLAERAAQILRTPAPTDAHPHAREIAGEAERLLGVAASAAASALSAFERQRAALAQEKDASLIGKLRRMFGPKS
jgi:hypothetical protein